MIKRGVLELNKGKMYMINRSGRTPVVSGQYLYLNVENIWVPVIIKFSDKERKWTFEHLDDIEVAGRNVAV